MASIATSASADQESPSDTVQSQSQTTFSSKTEGSAGSGSGYSQGSGKTDREEDFTKDNSASPVDLECAIQAERITKILDEAVSKIKAAICLSRLVQEGILRVELSSQAYDEVMFIYEQYDSHLFSASLLNMSAVEDLKTGVDREAEARYVGLTKLAPHWIPWCTMHCVCEDGKEWKNIIKRKIIEDSGHDLQTYHIFITNRKGDLSMKNRLSPEQGHLIYVLNSCPALKTVINELIDEMKQDYNPELKMSQPLMEYLRVFEHFRELMVRQLGWTAEEELKAKIHTRKLEISNAKLKVLIAELSELLIKEREEFEKTLEMRAQIIASLESDLSKQNFDAALKLHKNILDSERQMVLMTRAHVVKDELLKEEEEQTREHYENTLNSNMKDEKVQRQRRFKVETQLLSWVQKYDTEMYDKQVELDDFEAKYEEEKAKVEYLEKELEEQDKKYIPLMAEREEEYAQEMTTKMNNFMRDHAARILQTAWRQVLENRKEKRKLKRMLKKIREAEKKAERLNYLRFKREQKIEAARIKKEKKEAKEAKKKNK